MSFCYDPEDVIPVMRQWNRSGTYAIYITAFSDIDHIIRTIQEFFPKVARPTRREIRVEYGDLWFHIVFVVDINHAQGLELKDMINFERIVDPVTRRKILNRQEEVKILASRIRG